jgi:hypothetical protein
MMEDRFRTAGLKIVDETEEDEMPSVAKFVLFVEYVERPKENWFVASFSAQLFERMALIRDPNVQRYAATWPVNALPGLPTKILISSNDPLVGPLPDAEELIMEEATERIGLFLAAWDLAANGKGVSEETERRYGVESIPLHRKTWVMCRNSDCEHKRHMPLREYYMAIEAYVKEHPEAMMASAAPGLPCEKCGEQSAYKAVKCPNCALVFETGWKRGDFEDRCPNCGRSQIEVDRKRAHEAYERRQKQN